MKPSLVLFFGSLLFILSMSVEMNSLAYAQQGDSIAEKVSVSKLGAVPYRRVEQELEGELALIQDALNDYIEGSTNGQPKRLKKVFHPNLNLYSIKNGAISVWAGRDYILDTKEGQPTGERGKILSIDFENDAAVAKVEISNPRSSTTYVDYFMLLKVEDQWTIVHKMFTRRNKNSGQYSHQTDDDEQAKIPPPVRQ